MNNELFLRLIEIVFIYIPELILVMFLAASLLGKKITTGKLVLICIIHGGLTTPVIRHMGSALFMHTILLLSLLIATIIIITRINLLISVAVGILTMFIIVFSEYMYFNIIMLFDPLIVNKVMEGPAVMRIFMFIPLAIFYLGLNVLRSKFNISLPISRNG